jgi:hypothetical protein
VKNMDIEDTWIGPSSCDEKRSARERDLEAVWSFLTSTNGYRETYPLLSLAVDLFREAMCCYQNGAYMATALMCRACVETAIYLLTSRDITKWFEDGVVGEMEVDLSLVRAEWKCVICKAKILGYIESELERQVNEVREAGNFVAHYGQRYDREVEKAIKEPQAKGVKGWINRADSLRTLRKTAEILKAVIGKISYKRTA